MRKEIHLVHEFVEFMPDVLKESTVYISIKYATVAHKCCCGCGYEVITPLSPTDWRLIFDGESISLEPSIGNWNFPCKSHYLIRRSTVIWARKWSRKEIEEARAEEFQSKNKHPSAKNIDNKEPLEDKFSKKAILGKKIKGWFS